LLSALPSHRQQIETTSTAMGFVFLRRLRTLRH
jgi:hypothetical protein